MELLFVSHSCMHATAHCEKYWPQRQDAGVAAVTRLMRRQCTPDTHESGVLGSPGPSQWEEEGHGHLGEGDGVGVLYPKGDVVQDGLREQHRLLAYYRHLHAHEHSQGPLELSSSMQRKGLGINGYVRMWSSALALSGTWECSHSCRMSGRGVPSMSTAPLCKADAARLSIPAGADNRTGALPGQAAHTLSPRRQVCTGSAAHQDLTSKRPCGRLGTCALPDQAPGGRRSAG